MASTNLSNEARSGACRAAYPVAHEEAAPRKGLRRRIGSVGALYAHALFMAREAAERYSEFALSMADHGNDQVATLFRLLAEFEAEHAFHLAKSSVGLSLPRIAAGEHAWLDHDAPVPEARAFVFRMLTPRMALEIALRAEERAKAFFDMVVAESSDAAIRAVALDMARNEESHIAWVNEALERIPQRPSDDEYGDPTMPQLL